MPQIRQYSKNKHKIKKNPQKKYRHGKVSKKILEGLNWFPGTNLTLNSDVNKNEKYYLKTLKCKWTGPIKRVGHSIWLKCVTCNVYLLDHVDQHM